MFLSPGENDVLFIIGIQYFFQFHSAYGSRIDSEMAAPAKLNEFHPSTKYFILFLCHQNPDKKLEKWRKSYFIIPDLGSSQMTGTNVDNFILLCSVVTKRSMGERNVPVRKMKSWVGKYMIHDNNNKNFSVVNPGRDTNKSCGLHFFPLINPGMEPVVWSYNSPNIQLISDQEWITTTTNSNNNNHLHEKFVVHGDRSLVQGPTQDFQQVQSPGQGFQQPVVPVIY